jgi:hypothetical protein
MTRRTVVSLGVTLLSLALVTGCRITSLLPTQRSMPTSVDTATPLIAGERGQPFYPLQLDNRWHYGRTFDIREIQTSGQVNETRLVTAIERELLCDVPLGPHAYQVERTLETEPDRTTTTWIYYRQDRTGLYEFDDRSAPPCASTPERHARGAAPLSEVAPPGRLPQDPGVQTALAALEQRLSLVRYTLGLPAPSMRRPQPAPGEIVRLAYPLHTGQRWVIRSDPQFTAHVEGVDALQLPAGHFVAYRIRVDSPLFGPKDRVLVWYGREGFLQLSFHAEAQGTDAEGNPTVTVETDDHEVLDAIALVEAPAN